MTTALDTNVLIALWDEDPRLSATAERVLDEALDSGALVIAAPVFAELLAAPGRTEAFVDSFLTETTITVDWDLRQAIWRRAGRAFQAYAARRRRQRDPGPRRILADFIIGAHAIENGYRLLTLDEHLYRQFFSGIKIASL